MIAEAQQARTEALSQRAKAKVVAVCDTAASDATDAFGKMTIQVRITRMSVL